MIVHVRLSNRQNGLYVAHIRHNRDGSILYPHTYIDNNGSICIDDGYREDFNFKTEREAIQKLKEGRKVRELPRARMWGKDTRVFKVM